ncbi:MAG: HesA/MoeB/ThiF family protein [Desulfobacteraceae bacterium]|nr:HesA/MoeB/ThiF family protein [Desulfobacteraceae bacterium]
MNPHTDSRLGQTVADMAEKINDPAKRPVRVISEARAQQAADLCQTGLARAYTAALEAGIWPVRYMRNAASLSTQEQLKLAKSGIAVIGAGGLGGHIAAGAARTGIGKITIADPDAFAESNLNRQAMGFSETLGTNKAEAAKKILAAINPAVDVRAFTVAMDRHNAQEILKGADAAADALDSVAARLTLAAACRQAGIPLVHAAIAGFEGQIMTVFPRDPGLETLYGKPDQQSASDPAPEAMMGVPGVTPALMATLQVMEIIKILLGRGRVLRNRMLYVDLENAGFQEFSFNGEPDPS